MSLSSAGSPACCLSALISASRSFSSVRSLAASAAPPRVERRENQVERRQDHRDGKQERSEDHRDNKQERREDNRDNHQERREDNQDNRQERRR